ncbi:spore germination protein [Bacillus sp. HMF5848]|uniref:spore germination protein n=1 Tax=Bacillus sp. HMF5848 TaxID=2495421 RepID=UPI000F785B26|nr:spore germination protein [Bacillus sp. HMF5848]RSK29208.1 spore germination protein [Bacillus sp. HMF5848]
MEKDKKISADLQENTDIIKELFSSSINSDFTIRTLDIKSTGKKGALFFFRSAVNELKLQEAVIKPLLEETGPSIPSILTIEAMQTITSFNELTTQITSGNAVLLLDDEIEGLALNVANFKHRSIATADNENLLRGPKEAFTESLAVNISLIRKRLQTETLVIETAPIGKRMRDVVALVYMKDLLNDNILETLKQRLKNIDVDSVRSIEMLEQYIEERPYSLMPSILYTERPDRAAAFIEDGYLVLLKENSSACLILPVTFWSFFHSPEDHYLRFLYANFTRGLRAVAFFITLFVSAGYIAITNYHSEMIPPDLLLALANARERVPFPGIIELLIMEFAFELIREAGLRIPKPLGPTIGIVGALILGQAVVEANVISPIIVIVTALSGLSSFAVADVSFNFTIRLSRFMFIIAGGLFGIYGLVVIFTMWLMYMVSLHSFGVPYFAPKSPHYKSGGDTIFRRILQKETYRPGYLKPEDLQKKS